MSVGFTFVGSVVTLPPEGSLVEHPATITRPITRNSKRRRYTGILRNMCPNIAYDKIRFIYPSY